MSQDEKPDSDESSDEIYQGSLEKLSALTAGMDRRQKRTFNDALKKFQATEKNWESMDPQMRSDIWNAYLKDEEDSRPNYRDQALRLKKIRVDNKWSYEEFAEKLKKPKGEEPQPDWDFQPDAKKIADLEYGNLVIDIRHAELCFKRFGVSGQWLLDGIGVPTTRTNTLDMSRIISIEERLDHLLRIIQINLGQGTIDQLGKDGHESVLTNPDGGYGMKGAVNAILRLQLTEAQSEIHYLKNEISKQDTIIADLKRRMEEFFDEFYGTPEDRENSYQNAINTLEEKTSRIFEHIDLEENPISPKEYLKAMEDLQKRMAKSKNDPEKLYRDMTPEEIEKYKMNIASAKEADVTREKERKRKKLEASHGATKSKPKPRRRSKPKSA